MLDQVEAPARPVNKPGYRNGEIPIFAKLKARNLYLHESLPYKAISEVTGLPVKTLEQLAHREGWPAIRKANKARLTKELDERANAMRPAVVEVIAEMSEQHAIRGLQKAGEALERNDRDAAKDFQAYTAGVRNAVTVAKLVRDPAGAAAGEGSTNFNLFFMAAPGTVSATEPKQVTEANPPVS